MTIQSLLVLQLKRQRDQANVTALEACGLPLASDEEMEKLQQAGLHLVDLCFDRVCVRPWKTNKAKTWPSVTCSNKRVSRVLAPSHRHKTKLSAHRCVTITDWQCDGCIVIVMQVPSSPLVMPKSASEFTQLAHQEQQEEIDRLQLEWSQRRANVKAQVNELVDLMRSN